MVSTDVVRELVGPALAAAGLELWDVELSRDVLRILVERPGGVDLDTLTAASGVVSPILDEHPEATPAGRYQLEVSSPGLERTLRTPEQYRRFVGTPVTVKTCTPVAGSRRLRGRLVDASPDGIVLGLDEPTDGRDTVQLRYDQIDRTRTVVEWGPSPGRPAPGRRAPARPTAGRSATGDRSTDAALEPRTPDR